MDFDNNDIDRLDSIFPLNSIEIEHVESLLGVSNPNGTPCRIACLCEGCGEYNITLAIFNDDNYFCITQCDACKKEINDSLKHLTEDEILYIIKKYQRRNIGKGFSYETIYELLCRRDVRNLSATSSKLAENLLVNQCKCGELTLMLDKDNLSSVYYFTGEKKCDKCGAIIEGYLENNISEEDKTILLIKLKNAQDISNIHLPWLSNTEENKLTDLVKSNVQKNKIDFTPKFGDTVCTNHGYGTLLFSNEYINYLNESNDEYYVLINNKKRPYFYNKVIKTYEISEYTNACHNCGKILTSKHNETCGKCQWLICDELECKSLNKMCAYYCDNDIFSQNLATRLYICTDNKNDNRTSRMLFYPEFPASHIYEQGDWKINIKFIISMNLLLDKNIRFGLCKSSSRYANENSDKREENPIVFFWLDNDKKSVVAANNILRMNGLVTDSK